MFSQCYGSRNVVKQTMITQMFPEHCRNIIYEIFQSNFHEPVKPHGITEDEACLGNIIKQ